MLVADAEPPAEVGRRAGIVAESLSPLLADSDPDVRRAAAEALARITPQ